MLSIRPAPGPRTLTPNFLPCTIHHNGPLNIAKRYWSPQSSGNNGTSTAYLRGRKLRGRTVKLPAGYQGHLLLKTDREAQPGPPARQGAAELSVLDDDEDGLASEADEDEGEEVKVMEQKAVFDEMVIWGHEALPEDGDEYVKGVEEWIAFAEAASVAMH